MLLLQSGIYYKNPFNIFRILRNLPHKWKSRSGDNKSPDIFTLNYETYIGIFQLAHVHKIYFPYQLDLVLNPIDKPLLSPRSRAKPI